MQESDGGRTPRYFVVDAAALPETLLKVQEAKGLLESGKARTVNDAAERVGISRSAFYKYKDALRPFYDNASERIVTFSMLLDHSPGVLSGLLNLFADTGANILTINQNIPLNGQATVTISAQTSRMSVPVETLIDRASGIDGVMKFTLLAAE